MEKNAETLLQNVRNLLKEEGVVSYKKEINRDELIEKYILPALERIKDVQQPLYTDFISGKGFLRELKNKLIGKIANVTRNTVERSFMRQQKFNDNVYYLLKFLAEENRQLRSGLEKHGKNSKSS